MIRRVQTERVIVFDLHSGLGTGMMTAVLGVGDLHCNVFSGHGAGDNELISSVAGDFGAGDGVVLAVQNGFNVAFSGLAAIAVNVVDG